LILRWASTAGGARHFKLHPSRLQSFPDEAFDLRIDRTKVGSRGALDRRPKGWIDP
jgi:hypothetical protein